MCVGKKMSWASNYIYPTIQKLHKKPKDAVVNRAAYDEVAHCGGGGCQPQLVLITTPTRL